MSEKPIKSREKTLEEYLSMLDEAVDRGFSRIRRTSVKTTTDGEGRAIIQKEVEDFEFT